MKKNYKTILKNAVVAWKKESTRGTYQTLTNSDTVCVNELDFPTIDPNLLELDCSNGTLTPADNTVLLGDEAFSTTFVVAFPYNVLDATTKTNFEGAIQPLFEVAGFSITDPSGTDLQITRDDDTNETLSFYCNYDGLEFQARGCMITEIAVEQVVKEQVKLRVSIQGVLHSLGEGTALSSIAYSFDSELWQEGIVQINNGTNALQALTQSAIWKATNTVKAAETGTATKGIEYYYYTDKTITMELKTGAIFEGTDQRDDELRAAYANGTRVTCISRDSVGDMSWQVAGKLTTAYPSDNDGVAQYDITCKHTGTVADAKIILTYV